MSAELEPLQFYNVIGGEKRDGSSFFTSKDPSTMKPLWAVPETSQSDVDEAVDASKRAFKQWSRTLVSERQQSLSRLSERFMELKDEFTAILLQECGKPPVSADGEFFAAKTFFDLHAQYDLPETDVIEENESLQIAINYVPIGKNRVIARIFDTSGLTQQIGVVAAISAWNFPLMIAASKLAPAVLTGNTVILKPSPFTPYSTLKLVEICQEIFPPGVVQGFAGDDSLGAMLAEHPGVDKISFTGSVNAGIKVRKAAAKDMKHVTLELGGNDAAVVCPGVDLDKAVPILAMSAFLNSGQTCVATKRIFVHGSIYHEFVSKFVAIVKEYKFGPAGTEGVTHGPIQNERQFHNTMGIIKDCIDHQMSFAMGGDLPSIRESLLIEPSVVDDPPVESRVVSEEQFGPIVPILRWSDETEVIEKVNRVPSGLSASIWSHDNVIATRIGQELQVGNIYINTAPFPNPNAYFPTRKMSGIGGEWGRAGLKGYLNSVTIYITKP